MAKVKVKVKDNRLYINVKLVRGEIINDREFEFFNRKYVRCLMEGKLKRKNHIEYTGPVARSLYGVLSKQISKHEFFLIISNVIDAEKKVNESGLAPNKILYDIKYVFYNELTKEMQFIYLPLDTAKGKSDIMRFIDNIVYSVRPANDSEASFVTDFIHFVRSLKTDDLSQIEAYIQKEDRSAANSPKKVSNTQSSFITNKRTEYPKSIDINSDDTMMMKDIDLPEFDENATGYMGTQQTKSQVSPYANSQAPTYINPPTNNVNSSTYYDENATGFLDEGGTGFLDEGGTGFLQSDEQETGLLGYSNEQVRYPRLHRILTDEIIYINKPVFRIGKEKSYADYFIANNGAVSRNHCDIIIRGNRYFVMDLNSKNRTYINDHVIGVRQETEIFNGDHLKLANEEFVFYAG